MRRCEREADRPARDGKDKDGKEYAFEYLVAMKDGKPVAFDPNDDKNAVTGDLFIATELKDKDGKPVAGLSGGWQRRAEAQFDHGPALFQYTPRL